jgi:hypothetical protein
MKITIFDILKYIFKWYYLVILITLCSLGACYYYIYNNQSYTAQIVIRYTDANAKSGVTPTGEKLDVYEILSPNVVTAAIAELNVKANVEAVRANCAVLPIIPDNIVELKKSNQKEGKEYKYFPTDYIVKYTVGSSKSGGYARDVLDAIIKNYNIFYSEKYLTQSVLPEIEFDISKGGYDYLETTEIIDTKVKDALTYLEGKSVANSDFRSTLTGYSFADLNEKYKAIKNYDLPTLFSDILRGQITQNRDVLLKKYAYRKQQLLLENKSKQEDTNTAFSLMEQYVQSNKTVPNSYNNNRNETFNNQDVFINQELLRAKTTYDKLVDKYVLDGVKAGELIIDANYCDTIISIFSNQNKININTDELLTSVKNKTQKIADDIAFLYKITDQTISDFNRYNASQNIAMLSGVSISMNLSVNLYILIATVIGLLLGIVVAVAIEIIKGLKKEKFI